MGYNVQWKKVKFLNGVFASGYAFFCIHKHQAEFMKGGMLMKSKHMSTYGKEIAICDFRNYHIIDNFLHKCRITASAQAVIR